MENNKRSLWQRILRIAYQRPLARRWRKDDVSALPGWYFDSIVVVSCATLALHYFFGMFGVVGALSIPLSLFLVMENKKRSARKADDSPAATLEKSAATDAATADRRQPVKTLRIEDCSASIWAREAQVRGQSTTFYSVSFERSYKDRDGSWKYTRSFGPENLEKIVTLCQQASEWLQSL